MVDDCWLLFLAFSMCAINSSKVICFHGEYLWWPPVDFFCFRFTHCNNVSTQFSCLFSLRFANKSIIFFTQMTVLCMILAQCCKGNRYTIEFRFVYSFFIADIVFLMSKRNINKHKMAVNWPWPWNRSQ